MRINPIIVQKYGGACLETPAKIRAVASSLADLHSRGHRVVAIVSAMGKTTDELVKMAEIPLMCITAQMGNRDSTLAGESHHACNLESGKPPVDAGGSRSRTISEGWRRGKR
jgi:aspartokinase